MTKEEIIEKMAELEHEQWMFWSKSIIKQVMCSDARDTGIKFQEKHLKWIPLWVSYDELTEKEKEQDRIWARKALSLAEKDKIIITKHGKHSEHDICRNCVEIGEAKSEIEIQSLNKIIDNHKLHNDNYVKQIIEQSDKIQSLKDDIKLVEEYLDDMNGAEGSKECLCIFCKSREHNSVVGIVHTNLCPLTILREQLKEAK